MHDHFILTNVNGIAMDEADTRFASVAVENGRILRVGSETDMASLVEAGWPVRDMNGSTLLPGFIDTHQHLGLTGQVLHGLDFSEDTSLESIMEKVAVAAPDVPEGQWLFGFSFNELNLREIRLPHRRGMDAACPDRPLMIVHSSWHLCALNSRALALLDLPAGLPGMDMDGDGPTGVVRDPGILSHVVPKVSALTPTEVKLARFKEACRAAMKKGVTTLHCLEGGEFGPGDTRVVVEHQDELPLHAIVWNQVMDIEETLELGLPRIGGCICADGAISAYTAAFLEPYANQPGNCGTLNFTQERMDDFILQAHKAGLQATIHCEADRAIEQVLSAMEKALAAHPRDDHRHRIEHCEVPTDDQLHRMARAGIIAAVQPAFFPYLMSNMEDYERRLGPERVRRIQPYRAFLDAGVKMCGGSDCPITPYAPLEGVQAAVMHPVETERLTVVEALRLFTIDAAYAGFEERERGSIEPGKIADFAVLADDPTHVALEDIGSIKVEAVFVAGQPVR
ncbi:amidohydrolase [Pseudodesulfovibrio portus]|uniref:Amidohydrolase n=1 Tax=Pseudodesulfovibrio portus TaxID=231439 RepID=A0ABM8AUS0_9BACT|nr:amidohydrolase [Pseudodesulfovibrio portus]BDQ35249.1 amidohydrolase [Pseudodesulfovibrio portus]